MSEANYDKKLDAIIPKAINQSINQRIYYTLNIVYKME